MSVLRIKWGAAEPRSRTTSGVEAGGGIEWSPARRVSNTISDCGVRQGRGSLRLACGAW